MYAWASSYAAGGYTATAAASELRSYFQFSNENWYAAYRTAFAQVGNRESIKAVPMSYIIPTTMAETKDFDWRLKYNYVAKIEYFNTDTMSWTEKTIQAQSDDLLTKQDWRLAAEEVMSTLPGSPPWDEGRGLRYVEEELWVRERDW
jgi:hypothetical protein